MSFEDTSMRTWVILIGVILAGAVVFLATVVLPIGNLFQEDVITEATVRSSSDGQCVVDTPDDRPKVVKNCNLEPGTQVTVKYRPETAEAVIVSEP